MTRTPATSSSVAQSESAASSAVRVTAFAGPRVSENHHADGSTAAALIPSDPSR
jgi:hypothetical protein